MLRKSPSYTETEAWIRHSRENLKTQAVGRKSLGVFSTLRALTNESERARQRRRSRKGS